MLIDSQQLHEDAFVMDGLNASELPNDYVTETLPNAGIDAIQKTVGHFGDDLQTALDAIITLRDRLDRLPGVQQVVKAADLRRGGDLGIVFGFQDTTPIEDDPRNVRVFEQLGVKVIQLTYNDRNLSGNGCTERVDCGVSNFGLELIEEIEKNDVLLDLSHAGPQTARDALEAASGPVVFSHSNPASVHDHPRNVSDSLIEFVADTGGTVGVTAYPAFVADDPTIDDLLEHVDYLCDLVGPEHVALGFDFTDNRKLTELYSYGNPAYPDPPYSYPDGLESAADMPAMTKALVEHGYSESEIEKILGENLRRVLRDAWGE